MAVEQQAYASRVHRRQDPSFTKARPWTRKWQRISGLRFVVEVSGRKGLLHRSDTHVAKGCAYKDVPTEGTELWRWSQYHPKVPLPKNAYSHDRIEGFPFTTRTFMV